jgi:hypothetical protein
VNLTDIFSIYGANLSVVTDPTLARRDVDGNGGVNLTDLFEAYRFNLSVLPSPPPIPSGLTAELSVSASASAAGYSSATLPAALATAPESASWRADQFSLANSFSLSAAVGDFAQMLADTADSGRPLRSVPGSYAALAALRGLATESTQATVVTESTSAPSSPITTEGAPLVKGGLALRISSLSSERPWIGTRRSDHAVSPPWSMPADAVDVALQHAVLDAHFPNHRYPNQHWLDDDRLDDSQALDDVAQDVGLDRWSRHPAADDGAEPRFAEFALGKRTWARLGVRDYSFGRRT